MNTFGFLDDKLKEVIAEYISNIDKEILNQFDDLRDERALVGALQYALSNKKFTDILGNMFKQKNLNLDVLNFRAITEKSEKKTGVDFSIILNIITPNKQVIQKSLIIQAKNTETDYGKKIRKDQLEKMFQISEKASVLLYFTKKGIEVTFAKDILKNSTKKYIDINNRLKKDFTEFIFNFFKCSIGDHNQELYKKIENRDLSNYVQYTIK